MRERMTSLGTRIKECRERQSLTLSELARRSDVSKSHLHGIENGDILNPSFDLVMRIAWTLGNNPLTWWLPPDEDRWPDAGWPDASEWDAQTGKEWARYAFEKAMQILNGDAEVERKTNAP